MEWGNYENDTRDADGVSGANGGLATDIICARDIRPSNLAYVAQCGASNISRTSGRDRSRTRRGGPQRPKGDHDGWMVNGVNGMGIACHVCSLGPRTIRRNWTGLFS